MSKVETTVLLGLLAVVCVAVGARPLVARKREQKKRWFRNGQKWRTGCEGRISVTKRRHGLNRCRYKGDRGMKRWVGFGVIADPIGRATNDPPWPQSLLLSKCTGPAMRLQTTVDQTLIRGLVTRIDRCSSGGCSMSRGRASIRLSGTHYLLRFPHRRRCAPMFVDELDSFFQNSSASTDVRFDIWRRR
jgi:hypothetical protein